MKVYHVCEYCNIVFETSELEGQEGAIQLNGACQECNDEINFYDNTPFSRSYYYN